MRKISNTEIQEFLRMKNYSNSQPYESVLTKFARHIRLDMEANEATFEATLEKFLIGSSRATRQQRTSVLNSFNEFVEEFRKQNNDLEKTKVESQKQDTESTFENSESSESISRKQEALRQSQEMQQMQAEELEKTRLENLRKAEELEKAKKLAIEIEAKKKAEALKIAMEKRISERFSGFVSEEIPQKFVSFDPSEYKITEAQQYFEQDHEKETFYDLMDQGKHVILSGQAGTGKTELSLLYAHDRNTSVYKYSCSADTKKNDLIGSKTIDENEKVKIVCGMIVKAVLTGNKDGKAILVLDEGNALIPKVQILLQGLTDKTGFIDLPEGKIKINKGVKFNVVITMNDNYSGTNPLNKPIRNRFEMIEMQRLTKETKMKIFESYNVDNDFKEKLCKLDDRLDQLQSQMKLSNEEALSVRSMKSILEDVEEWEFLQRENAKQRALETNYITKFSDKEDRKTIQREIDLIFN